MTTHTRTTHTQRCIAVTLVVVGLMTLATSCGSSPRAALPGTTDRVTSDRPLTTAQATDVRDAARALTFDMVDRIAIDGRDVDEDRSYESWTRCTAAQKDLFQTTYNGLLYTAQLFMTGPTPLPATDVHALIRDLGVDWESDSPGRGQRGIYSVRLPDRGALGFTVLSPCYFLRDAGDSGMTSDETTRVTGFLRQELRR